MTAEDVVRAAHAFPEATIVPLHYEGWTHFLESREKIEQSFAEAGLDKRVGVID